MSLIKFCERLFKKDGIILIDSYGNKYRIGNPKKEKPITLKLLDKKLNYKLLLCPDIYFGEAYMDGTLVIENGTLTEFLDIAFQNIGREDINTYGKIINSLRDTYRFLTNFNFVKKSKKT